jgi:hypothetical protein
MHCTHVCVSGVALFIDIENFVGHCAHRSSHLQITPICDKLKEFAPLRYRRSFGDLNKSMVSVGHQNRIADLRHELLSNFVAIEEITFVNVKNYTDMHLSTAALSLAYENANISHFAFMADDRGYVALYNKLRELGKIVIVISAAHCVTSKPVIEAADIVLCYEDIIPIEPGSANIVRTGDDSIQVKSSAETHEQADNDIEPYFGLLISACKLLESEGKKLFRSSVKNKMIELQPDFSQKKLEYKKFTSFLNAAVEKNYITLKKQKNGDIIIELNEFGRKAAINISAQNKSMKIQKNEANAKLMEKIAVMWERIKVFLRLKLN